MQKMLNSKIWKTIALWLLAGAAVLAVELLLAKKFLPPRDVHPIFLSCVANILLWMMIVHTIRRDSSIRFGRMHYGVILFSCMALIAYYAFLVKERPFLYYSDYGVYYGNQLSFSNPFRGLGRGWRSWTATFVHDYPQFMSVFFELPYRLGEKTAEGFVLACCATIFPPLLTCLSALIQKIGAMANAKRPRLFYLLAYSGTLSMPLLHWSLSRGMPDAFGLVFALLIMLVTLDYRFEKVEWGRWLVLLGSIIALSLSRRWYMYWMVGYIGVYALNWLSWAIARAVRKQTVLPAVRNACLFVFPSLLVIYVLLKPMILHVLSYDYGRFYAFYSGGGMLYEMKLQLGRIGYLPMLLMGVGLIYGIFCRRTRRLALSAIAGFVIAAYLFVNVQNTGWHQNLLTLPFFWVLLVLGCMVCSAAKIRIVRGILSIAAAGIFAFQTAFGFVPGLTGGRWLSSGSLWEQPRNDIAQIRALSVWIAENCTRDESAYMIPHSSLYMPDMFRTVLRPDRWVESVLPYGSAVPGTHVFPTPLFDAKYVLTCEPFKDSGLSGKYNEVFLKQVAEGKFELEKTFDMENGYLFYIYRRVQPVTLEEIEVYRTAFAEENKAFPENFDQVFDAYIAQMEKN